MVILFAIKEVSSKEEHDETCANLIQLIGQNCHSMVVDGTMRNKYNERLSELLGQPKYMTHAALFLSDFVYNKNKFIIEPSDPPEIPESLKGRIPREDHYVVKAGLISQAIIVTDEKKLRDRINKHHDVLGLKALTPAEALGLARDQ